MRRSDTYGAADICDLKNAGPYRVQSLDGSGTLDFTGWIVCLIAIPISAAVRLLTIFVAREREEAWRWVAYSVPGLLILAMLLPFLDKTGAIWVYIAILAFWILIGSAFGASLASRLVQGKPRIHKDEE